MSKRKVTAVIQTYSRKAREMITSLVSDSLGEVGIEKYASDVLACMDELIKNAIKANYKFVLILEGIGERLLTEKPGMSTDEIQQRITEILKEKQYYDALAEELIADEEISHMVREILNEESNLLRIKNKAYMDKREVTSDENSKIDLLTNLIRVRRELDGRNIKVIINIERDGDFVFMEVTNNAPIMERDLNRIFDKRDEFRACKEGGREHEFFMNNLDTSDSGFGLGYATIDSFLYNMQLDPYQTIQIIAASNTTVMLSFQISALKKSLGNQ